jgi:hypothetical protein
MFQVYPQPATDVLFVNTGADHQQAVSITNLAGQRVAAHTVNAGLSTVDVSALPAGMYVLQVGNSQRTIAIQ